MFYKHICLSIFFHSINEDVVQTACCCYIQLREAANFSSAECTINQITQWYNIPRKHPHFFSRSIYLMKKESLAWNDWSPRIQSWESF